MNELMTNDLKTAGAVYGARLVDIGKREHIEIHDTQPAILKTPEFEVAAKLIAIHYEESKDEALKDGITLPPMQWVLWIDNKTGDINALGWMTKEE